MRVGQARTSVLGTETVELGRKWVGKLGIISL
jgi:hypothetical protein